MGSLAHMRYPEADATQVGTSAIMAVTGKHERPSVGESEGGRQGGDRAPVGPQGHVGSVLGVRERRRAAAEGRSCENRVSAACGHPGAGLLVCVSVSKAAAT